MRPTIILAMAWAVPAVAAPPAKAPPVSINIRTVGDLAVACSAKPVNPGNAALLNFCNGFAQGVVQTEQLNSGGSKICLPSPAPKRSETMKQFVSWVMADAARKEEGASAGFVRFMSEQYPCKCQLASADRGSDARQCSGHVGRSVDLR
jgi:Rap1a immunity proteins